jgi:small redox-active disulfide protein 2
MKNIKVLGPGCPKCKTTYANALEAVKQAGIDVQVEKVEDLQEMFKYDVLTTPVLIIDEVVKIKGRVADVKEIVGLLGEN